MWSRAWCTGYVVVLLWGCGSDTVSTTSAASSTAAASTGGTGGGAGAGGAASTGGAGGGGSCEEQCNTLHPQAAVPLEALESCIYCNACYDLCDGGNATFCPNGGMEGGCSAMFNDCNTCAYSMCSWNFDGVNFTGVCATEYESCDAVDCLGLKSCLDAC